MLYCVSSERHTLRSANAECRECTPRPAMEVALNASSPAFSSRLDTCPASLAKGAGEGSLRDSINFIFSSLPRMSAARTRAFALAGTVVRTKRPAPAKPHAQLCRHKSAVRRRIRRRCLRCWAVSFSRWPACARSHWLANRNARVAGSPLGRVRQMKKRCGGQLKPLPVEFFS